MDNNTIIQAAKEMGLIAMVNLGCNIVAIAHTEQESLSLLTNKVDGDGNYIFGSDCYPCYDSGDYDNCDLVYGWPVH